MVGVALDTIIETIRERGSLRTPELARAFNVSDAELDRALWPACGIGQALISCVVEVAGKRVKEYRASAIGGGKLNDTFTAVGRPRTAVDQKTDPAFGSAKAVTQALAARFTPAPIASAPAAAKPTAKRQEANPAMSTTDKILKALEKHGPMTTAQLREHVDYQFLSTVTGQLARKGRIKKLGGADRGTIYGLEGQKASEGAPAAPKRTESKPARKAAVKRPHGSLQVRAAARGLKSAFNDKRVAEILATALRGWPLELVPAEVSSLAIALTEDLA